MVPVEYAPHKVIFTLTLTLSLQGRGNGGAAIEIATPVFDRVAMTLLWSI